MLKSLPAREPEFAAFVAIDWGDQEHAWALEVPGCPRRESGSFAQTPEAIATWVAELTKRFEGRPVAVGLEQARGALIYALSQYAHLALYVIHPGSSSRYRALVSPSGSKDDPKDADLCLDLLVKHRDRLRLLRPDTEPSRKLQLLAEKRRQLVDERTAYTNRVTDLLKCYYPQILRWFDNLQMPLVRAFLERWPTLEQVQGESSEGLREFFRQHQCRSQRRIEERLEEIRKARSLLQDRAVIDPAVLTVQALLAVVAALNDGVAKMDTAIDEVFDDHPDRALFTSFPAAGPAMAPRLAAAFGTQRDRFGSANEVQSFSGIAPVTARSGGQEWIHFRWACPKFVRQTFHEYAALSIQQCEWAREFYDRQRAQHKGHHAAVRALAFKWIRIMFRCWKAGVPYQPEIFLAARQARRPAAGAVPSKVRPGSAPATPAIPDGYPFVPPAACGSTVEFQFKKVAGFWKYSTAGA